MKKNLILKALIALTLTQTLLTGSGTAQASSSSISVEEAGIVAARSQVLADSYDWRLEGEWTAEELKPIFKAAVHLESYIESITGTEGQTWIKENIGAITFHHATPLNSLLKMHFAMPNGDIYLYKEAVYSRNNTYDVLHEIAHILDNRQGSTKMATFFGGGPSEQMVAELGGDPDACWLKIICPAGYIENVAGPDGWGEGAYGNWSVADDFAETLSWAVFKPENVPTSRLSWMESYIQSTVTD